MTWKPGESGNPAGAKKSKPWREALDRALAKLDSGQPIGTTLALIAEKCAADAMLGDKDARREIAERMDGKVPQAVIGGDGDDPPVNLKLQIERTIVDPKAETSSGARVPPVAGASEV